MSLVTREIDDSNSPRSAIANASANAKAKATSPIREATLHFA